MNDGIYAALSGAIAQSSVLETAANNLANASTDGYQRVRPVFREVLAQAGGNGARGTSYVTVASTAVDGSAGALRPTGRSLDAALPDGVYLAVSTPRGERYTRAVSLTVDPDGSVRTARGAAVADESGAPLRVPLGDGELALTADGELRRAGAPVGRLRLVRFDRPEQLTQEGGTLLAPGGATPAATGAALTVGSVEESNATMVSAMTDLVTATRTFDAFQRVIDAFREADRRVVTSVPG
jgi:flagellar basal-body rod protein FlgF